MIVLEYESRDELPLLLCNAALIVKPADFQECRAAEAPC